MSDFDPRIGFTTAPATPWKTFAINSVCLTVLQDRRNRRSFDRQQRRQVLHFFRQNAVRPGDDALTTDACRQHCIRPVGLTGATSTPGAVARSYATAFRLVGNGSLKLKIGGVDALAEAARAHIDMESRTTTGKLLLIRLRRLLSFNIFFLVRGNSKYTDWCFKAFKRIGPQTLYLAFDPGQLHESL